MIKAGLLRVQVLDVAAGNTCVLLCLNLIAAMKGADDRLCSVECRGFCVKRKYCLYYSDFFKHISNTI